MEPMESQLVTEPELFATDETEQLFLAREEQWHAANQPQFTEDELDAMIAWDEATREGL
jgi:hypothetical protein